jgi:hypothetical protein
MMYFVRQNGRFITRDTISQAVHVGTLRQGASMQLLLRLMSGIYVPSISAGTLRMHACMHACCQVVDGPHARHLAAGPCYA